MGLLRDRVDMKAAVGDLARAAKGGGPKQYARHWGRPRGADRFPSAKSRKRGKR
jgi:hypothetical protein